jgi:hypothetical protein
LIDAVVDVRLADVARKAGVARTDMTGARGRHVAAGTMAAASLQPLISVRLTTGFVASEGRGA